ncbi:MAG: peptide ABC transporter substrate-binding protein [Burkholderiales bacterium]|nr:peptide ABC transporter substrate-binding protein [Burkholderiales bacterium]
MRIKKIILQLSMILLGTSIIACSNKDKAEDKSTLRVDVGTEIPTFDPVLAEDGYTYRVINDLFAGLVDFDQANRPIAGMASSWDISSDGLIYTFHLRDGLKFSDGSQIKASDFVFSWKRLVNPKTGSSYAFLLKDVAGADAIIDGKASIDTLGISAPDDKTFIVKLSHPTNAFLNYITTPDAFVVSESAVKKYGSDWTKPQNIVTSGAYVLKEHVVNGYILVEKNPLYYQESIVSIPQVKYFPFIDANASISNYKTGALDTTWQNVPIDQYQTLKKQYPNELHTFPWERVEFLNLNMKLPKYANNAKLRQALAMSIDRDTLSSVVLGAGQTPLYGVVTPTIENGNYKDIRYSWADLSQEQKNAKAKELYKEAGFSTDKPLEITLKYQTNDLYKKVMIAITSMWQSNLGIKVTLVNEERKMLSQDWKNANYDISQGTWGADYNSVTTYIPMFICNNGNNRSHYCNPKYDALVAKAEATSDFAQQTALYKEALNIVMNDMPIIPLYEPTHQRLVAPRVQGYDIDTNYLDNVQSKWFTLSK